MSSTNTAIEWTDTTWNPTTGCDRVSPGCDHCYAATLAARLKAMGNVRYQNDGNPKTSGPGFGLTLHAAPARQEGVVNQKPRGSQGIKAKDSPRWCDKCQKWGDHHTDKHDVLRTKSEHPSPLHIGYIVVVPEIQTDDIVGWTADWDGEVHDTEEDGREALRDCRAAGWSDAVLTKLVHLDG